MKVSRVATGIYGLDKLIEGGFKKNSTNLVAGGPGSGKTIFAIQFLVEGVKKGEPGIYITFEEKKFVFLEYTPEQVKKILTEGGGLIESVIEKLKITRLVIDSISSSVRIMSTSLIRVLIKSMSALISLSSFRICFVSSVYY